MTGELPILPNGNTPEILPSTSVSKTTSNVIEKTLPHVDKSEPPANHPEPNDLPSPSSVADTIQADELDESIEQIETSKKEIDKAVQESHSPSSNPILSHKISLRVSCEPSKSPFTIKGGAENAELIYVDTILHPDLLDKLNAGDVLLSANKK